MKKTAIITVFALFVAMISGNALATQNKYLRVWQNTTSYDSTDFDQRGGWGDCGSVELPGVDYCSIWEVEDLDPCDELDKMAIAVRTPTQYLWFDAYYDANWQPNVNDWQLVDFKGSYFDGRKYVYWGREEGGFDDDNYCGLCGGLMTVVYETVDELVFQRTYISHCPF